jgi:Derlin-2/3
MNRNNQQPGFRDNQTNALMDWFKSIPLITKLFFIPTFIFGALATYKIISPFSLILNWSAILRFEIWRLVTPFMFAGGFSWQFLMHLYMIYSYFPRYEANPYNTGAGGSVADVLWMVILSMIMLLIAGYFLGLFLLGDSLLSVIVYLWSRREPDAQISIFMFKFKAVYIPWVYLAMTILGGGSIIPSLTGIVVGHIYFYLVEVFPPIYHYSLIHTPQFCKDTIPFLLKYIPTPGIAEQNPANAAFQPPRSAGTTASSSAAGNADHLRFRSGANTGRLAGDNRPATYSWGTGRTLGAN